MRTRTVLLVALLASILALAGCGGGGGAIKIAILAPLSGDVSTFGESTRDGALLAISEYNEAGGVLGREIEVVIEDSQCSPEAAVSAANKVIDQDGVKFIIGEVCSSASIPISEIVTQKGVLQISPTSTSRYYHEEATTNFAFYDPDMANQLLDEAGYSERNSEGFRVYPDGSGDGAVFELASTDRSDPRRALAVLDGRTAQVTVEFYVESSQALADRYEQLGLDPQAGELQ